MGVFFIILLAVTVFALAFIVRKNIGTGLSSLVNPKGGINNCLACTLAAIKTAHTGNLYIAGPGSPADNIESISDNLGYKNSIRKAQIGHGYWRTEDIETWLNKVYPEPNSYTQHFLIAIYAGERVKVSPELKAHAIYGYRRKKNGRIKTTVMNPQNGSLEIEANTYSMVAAVMINPYKLSGEVLSHFEIFKIMNGGRGVSPKSVPNGTLIFADKDVERAL